jgi:hypothetical protein
VQHRGEPQLRAKVVPAEAQQRFGGTGKEPIVEGLLVLPDRWVEAVRQSEHQVEIGDGQEPPGLGREPVLAVNALTGRAMPVAAGVRQTWPGTGSRAASGQPPGTGHRQLVGGQLVEGTDDAGANGVWLCAPDGAISFLGPTALQCSNLCPQFPKQAQLR